jgi:RNA polymerase sigma factor (sigma-70 family)
MFFKVFLNLSTFKFKSRLSTWIGKIAYNTCLNHIGKDKSRGGVKMSFDETVDEPTSGSQKFLIQSFHPNADESIVNQKLLSLIYAGIETLPGHYKTVISLYHLDELSYKEIASIMELSMDHVKVLLFRGRKMLRHEVLKNL